MTLSWEKKGNRQNSLYLSACKWCFPPTPPQIINDHLISFLQIQNGERMKITRSCPQQSRCSLFVHFTLLPLQGRVNLWSLENFINGSRLDCFCFCSSQKVVDSVSPRVYFSMYYSWLRQSKNRQNAYLVNWTLISRRCECQCEWLFFLVFEETLRRCVFRCLCCKC